MTEEPFLNYTGEWTQGGHVDPADGTEIQRKYLWELLTRFQYMGLLSNIPGPSGRSVTAYGEKLPIALELGADWGHCFPVFEGCFEQVYGLEIVDWAVKAGIEKGRRIIQGTIDHIPFRDCTFDAVVSRHVLEHCRNPDSMVAGIYRVLKMGGWTAHALPCTRDGATETANDFHTCCMNYVSWMAQFVRHGFSIVTTYFTWATNIEEFNIIARRPTWATTIVR